MSTTAPTPRPPAPLARLTRAVDRWADRQRWLTSTGPGMVALDVAILCLLSLLWLVPLPVDWFTAQAPVYELVDATYPQGALESRVGEPFRVEDRQTYRLRLQTPNNPTYFLQVVDAAGQPVHGWREKVSYRPGELDTHFRFKAAEHEAPLRFRVTVTPSEIGQTLPFAVGRLQVFAFNRAYFELVRIQSTLGWVLIVVAPVYYYLRYASPLLHRGGGEGGAAVARSLEVAVDGLHGLDGPLAAWRRLEQPGRQPEAKS